MRRVEVGDVVSTGPGTAKGHLKLHDMPDGRPLRTPVIVVNGARDGPVLWLHGCVHGNEYCGTYIIHEVLRGLDPASLRGAVVALPALNRTAFRARQRMSPFEGYGGGDMNRCFPGRADGSLTEQMAHAVYQPLKAQADAFIDFHTAMTEDVRWALFPDTGDGVGERSEGIARAFGLKSTLPAPTTLLRGSAMMTAAADGIAAYIVEIGGKGPAFTAAAVSEGAERLGNVLRHLDMVDGAVSDHGPLTYFSTFAWECATRGGLFRRAVKCGDRLEVGTVLGRFYDLYGRPDGEAVSRHAGIVLAIHPGPTMVNGETLVHIGLEPREV